METQVKGNKKKYRKYASQKQLTAIQLRAQGLSPTEAARKAGYSEASINTPKKIFTSQAIVTAVDKFKLELNDKGLTTDYMSAKLKEWMEATITVKDKLGHEIGTTPAYDIQQKAYQFLKEILIDQEKKQDPTIKKTITLTEYLQPQTNPTLQEVNIEPLEDLLDQPHIIDTPEKKEEYKEPTLEELII